MKSEISEDTQEGSDDSNDDLPPVGNGINSFRTKLERDMPQLISNSSSVEKVTYLDTVYGDHKLVLLRTLDEAKIEQTGGITHQSS